MSYELNKKIADLVPYDPITGDYSIRLDANESCFNLPDNIKEKLADAMKKMAFNRYPDPMADGAVTAFADFYGLNKDFITAGNGSDELISIILSTFTEKGDTLVTVEPDFSMYGFYGSLYEVNVKHFMKKDDLTFTADELLGFCKENNAKAVIFSNPCNPTSLGLDKNEIGKLIKGFDGLVILDEAYMDFWGETMLYEIENYDNCIILKTCSKAIGMAAIRMGFAVSNKTITNALRAVKSPYNTDTFAQTAANVILSEKEYLKNTIKTIIENVKELYADICDIQKAYPEIFIKVYETKTNFIFIETPYCKEIYTALLDKSIAVRCFNGYLRISTGTADENKILISTLKSILDGMKGR